MRCRRSRRGARGPRGGRSSAEKQVGAHRIYPLAGRPVGGAARKPDSLAPRPQGGKRALAVAVLTSSPFLAGCAGIQSALDPAGVEADAVAALFWVMVAGAAVIWLAVMGVLYYATRRDRVVHSETFAGRVILWAGAILPTLILTALLAYGLSMMPRLRPWDARAAEDAPLRIEVVGEQFWWRVTYHRDGMEPVVSANEIRMPVGERVTFTLRSADVIHAFWIPSLGGKMDMIPGRENTLTLEATKAGIYRGPCAEFCGSSHALMALAAVVMETGAFDEWLARQAEPSPGVGENEAGRAAFLANGCGACHAVAGTEANGTIGPDLSHLGSRVTLGAGIVENSKAGIGRFIAETDHVKPGVRMPAYRALPDEEIDAIAGWLKGLE
ncbi:MAG: cytochrome c oxidase subunit II [Rhizobiaceae bacterium]|nr:cytochrome c oxidase subunit II [Rhizobiaceae bacterium]MCV0404832.1 cytochrome c oxidase subunit II [Rhizobiaceae bacterium]